MIIQFDTKQMLLIVSCGPLEKYEPSEQMSIIHNKVEELKKKLQEFQNSEVFPVINEINQMVAEENKKVNKTEGDQSN